MKAEVCLKSWECLVSVSPCLYSKIITASIVSSFYSLWVGAQKCEIVNAVATKDSPTTLALIWESTSSCSIPNTFRITAKHIKYMACKQNPKDFTVEDLTYFTDQTFVVLEKLVAYSLYEISIFDMVNNVDKIIKNVVTSEDAPQTRPQLGLPTLVFPTAITFFWNSSSSEQCHMRFGKENGFRAELRGLDPWVDTSNPLKQKESIREFLPEFYAQNLEPFTSYSLKVFVKNVDGGYNPNVYLEMKERTLPIEPHPPLKLVAARTSSQIARLKWTIRYPPTGIVKNFIIRVGEKVQNETIWKRRIEVSPVTSICQDKYYCHTLERIFDNTTYIFQIQVFNDNVERPSDFSSSAILEGKLNSRKGKNDLPGDLIYENRGLGSTGKVLIIIFTVTAVVLLVLIITAFYYKFKLKKLKIVYDQSRSQFYDLSRSSFQMSDNSSAPSSLNGNGYPQLLSFEKSSQESTLSSHILGNVRFQGNPSAMVSNDQPIFSQIYDIQSRRLPDPPLTQSRNFEHQEKFYTSIEPQPIPESRDEQRIFRRFESYLDEDRSTDHDGYLRPTFRPVEDFRIILDRDASQITFIQPISYERVIPDYDVPKMTCRSSMKETLPLITENIEKQNSDAQD